MPGAFPRGRFVWHELLTTDLDAAARFYTKVFGWKVQPFDNDPSYRLWMKGTTTVGGLMALPADARRMGAPPQWTPYVAVPDVDEVVRQAQSLGGRVYVAPQDIPVGRFATLADPQGASFAVYRPAPARDQGKDTAEIGEFGWRELATTDWRAAWDFYRKLFGWEVAATHDMGPGGPYTVFKRAGGTAMIGGVYTKAKEMAGPPNWLCYVEVANTEKTAAAVKDAGGAVVNGPMDVPGGGRIAMCLDPQGAAFAMHTTPAAERAAPKRPTAAAKKAKKTTKKKAKARPKAKRAVKRAKKAAPRKKAARRPRARRR